MADPHVVSALRRKREDIEKALAAYRRKVEAAERDLSAINAALRLFELEGERSAFPAYVDVTRLFKRGEIVKLCLGALAQEGPLDTRELALRVVRAKGLDEADAVLRSSVAFRIVQALRLAHRRGKIGDVGKRAGVRVWTLPKPQL